MNACSMVGAVDADARWRRMAERKRTGGTLKRLFLLFLAGAALVGLDGPAAAELGDPAAELSRETGLPVGQINGLLSNCSANPASMSFCARRDLLVAESELHGVVNKWSAVSPTCNRTLDMRLKEWQASRDRVCKKTANDDSPAGLSHATSQAICETSMTQSMTQRIRERGCR